MLTSLWTPRCVTAFAAAIVATSVAATVTTAARPAQEDHARVSVVPSVVAFAANQPFKVAVKFDLNPGWHIYWMNPGQSGQAPQVTLNVPSGWKVSGPTYPAPHTFIGAGEIEGYGYATEAALVFTVTPDDQSSAGSDMPLTAEVSYLVCDDERCVPGKARASASVKPANRVVKHPDAAWWERLEKSLPSRFGKPAKLKGTLPTAGETVTLTLALDGFPAGTDVGLYPPSLNWGEVREAKPRREGDTLFIDFVVAAYAGANIPAEPLQLTVGYTDADNVRRALLVECPPR